MNSSRGISGFLVVGGIAIIIVMASVVVVLAYGGGSAPVPGALTSTSSLTSYSSSSSTQDSETSSMGPSTTYSTVTSSGLQLRVALNSSSIQSREEVAAQIELMNTLSQNVSLAVIPNQNISGWNGEDFFCSMNPSHSLVGFGLFKGRFAAGNISAAGSPLQLAGSSVEIPCAYSLPLNDTIFLPKSDRTVSFSYYGQTNEPSYAVTAEVNATTGYRAGSTLSGDYRTTSGILGYWNAGFGKVANATLGSNDFTYLQPGEYTIVAMDDWGQTIYAYFQVTPDSNTTSSSVSSSSALLAGCPGQADALSEFGTVTAGTITPATICIQLYYYSAIPTTLNLTNALSIQALQYTYNGSVGTPTSFNGASNFTVTSSQSRLVMGGPSDENEGTMVAFNITANAGASGTYQLGFLTLPGFGGNSWLLGPQEPLRCGYYGTLVAGSGQPNYDQGIGGCITYSMTSDSGSTGTTSSSPSLTIPGIPYGLLSDNLYFRIVGASSSTGSS